jgi:hypothetical protein
MLFSAEFNEVYREGPESPLRMGLLVDHTDLVHLPRLLRLGRKRRIVRPNAGAGIARVTFSL